MVVVVLLTGLPPRIDPSHQAVRRPADVLAFEAHVTVTPALSADDEAALVDEWETGRFPDGAPAGHNPFLAGGAELALVADAEREQQEAWLEHLAARLGARGYRLDGWIYAERVRDGEIVWMTRIRAGRLARQQRVVLWRDEEPAAGLSLVPAA